MNWSPESVKQLVTWIIDRFLTIYDDKGHIRGASVINETDKERYWQWVLDWRRGTAGPAPFIRDFADRKLELDNEFIKVRYAVYGLCRKTRTFMQRVDKLLREVEELRRRFMR